jgi:gliding motility-associated-like protein
MPSGGGVGPLGYNAPLTLFSGLSTPAGIALDAAGNVYVADPGNDATAKFPVGGGAPFKIGQGFNAPSGVSVDAAGNVFVADAANNQIKKIPVGGGAAFSLSSGFNQPAGILVDFQGNLYVADAGNNAVKKIFAGNNVANIIGSGFNQPTGLSIDFNGNVYVADYGNNAVKMIPSNGSPTVTVGSGFNHPYSVFVDNIGNVWVADQGNNAIKKIPLGGGAPITIASGLNQPSGVAVDAAGTVYFTDKGNAAVKYIKRAGGYYVNPTIPPGLVLDEGTGVISGTPASPSQPKTYTVTAFNSSGSVQAGVNIKYLPSNPNLPFISYGGPYTYTEGNSISLSPTSSGGAVPTTVYGGNSIFAGSGAIGSLNGTGTGASFSGPTGVVRDTSGNLYVADQVNNLIRKITPAGDVTTLAGSGAPGAVNANGASASFNNPRGIAVDAQGNVYVADRSNNLVRKITPAGDVTTFAGSGSATTVNGVGTAASFNGPTGLAFDTQGNLFVVELAGNVIRRITPGASVFTFAGIPGTPGLVNGNSNVARFNQPAGIAVDALNNLYIADSQNNVIRRVNPQGMVSTLSGHGIPNGSNFSVPAGITTDPQGNVYVAGLGNNLIHKVITTGYAVDKPLPIGLTFNSTNGTFSGTPTGVLPTTFYVVTAYNTSGSGSVGVNITIQNSIDPATSPKIFTIAGNGLNFTNGDGGRPYQASFARPYAMARDRGGNIYLATFDNKIRKIISSTNTVITLAGTGTSGYSGDGGAAINAQFNLGLNALALDLQGNLYIADGNNNVIRKIDSASNVITTIAGTGTAGYSGDGGLSTAAQLNAPEGMAFDASGNLYFSDVNNHVIRKIDAVTHNVSTIAGGGAMDNFTAPVSATDIQLGFIERITFDKDYNLFLADENYGVIWKMDAVTHNFTNVAGNGIFGNAGDGGPATSASINGPMGLVVDSQGNIFIADQASNVIRKVDATTHNITTFAGNGAGTYSGDGGAATLGSINFITDIILDNNGIMYVDDYANNVVRKIGGTASPQTITFPPFTTQVYGAPDISVAAVQSSSGLDISGTGTNPAVATAANDHVHIVGVGQTTFTVTQPGDANFLPATPVSQTLTVTAAPLTITADDKTKIAGSANPPLTASFTGLVYGETSSVLTTQPTIATTATNASPAGTYPITASGAAAANYAISYVAGTLTVTSGGMNEAYTKLGYQAPDVNLAILPAVHQAVSPNGDGINDVLQIDNITSYPDNKLTLFNSNGTRVFEASGYDNANKVFDGHSSVTGVMQQAGTYFYQLDYKVKGETKRASGYFVIKY